MKCSSSLSVLFLRPLLLYNTHLALLISTPPPTASSAFQPSTQKSINLPAPQRKKSTLPSSPASSHTNATVEVMQRFYTNDAVKMYINVPPPWYPPQHRFLQCRCQRHHR